LNLMLFINSSGQIVFGKGFDLDNEEEISVPQSLQEHLTDDALLRHPDTESSITGIVLLPEGPLLVASRPILTSEEEGPLRGTMIMGRYLDSTEVERLAEITHVSLSVRQSDDEQMPPDFQAARAALSPSFPQEASVFVQPLSAESVAGYALLNDIYGEPSLMLRVDMPREIYQQGQTSMLYLVFLLMVGGMAFTGMSSLMTDKIVISRLVRLNADVNSIGASGDLSTRVLATGRDELSSLADTINGMLAALERSQTERKRAEEALRESERRFRDVARTTGDWIWEVDAEGRYTYVSPVVEQVLGYTPAEMLGRHYCDFFHPNEELRVLIQEIFHRKEPFVNLVGSNVHKDGHEVILETSALPLTGAQGNLLGYRGAYRDVTAEHRLEERLAMVHALGRELVLSGDEQQVAHAAVDAARLLLRCQLCGLWLVDEERKMLVRRAYYASEQVADITILPLDGERGIIVAVARSGEHVYLPDVREDTRHIDAGIGIRAELCVPLKVEKWVIGVLNVESEKLDAFGGDDRRLLSTLADQAAMAIENARLFQRERKQREQLRTLTTRLTEAEEAERQRLARELHDQVGQNLTALGLNLNIVRSQMPKETADLVRPRLDDSLALVEQMTERIYGVMADLRPPVLDDYGLMAALRWY
ncbi:MAG: GAF domain-containing protein, partial [Anaerolineae bacterium]|nr:GAF domain-containing protein [Anaerolineae bacterium]